VLLFVFNNLVYKASSQSQTEPNPET
jgi:hypothetical protein